MPLHVLRLLSCSIAVWLSFSLFAVLPTKADPWTAVDDRLLRTDIELLADYGVLRGPLASWPVNWRNVRAALDAAQVETLPPFVRDAYLRVQSVAPGRGVRARNWGVELDVAATNEQALVRGYGAQARGDYDAQMRFIGRSGGSYLSLSVGLQDEPFGRNLTFDNAYFAQEIGNWIAYVGTVERWWSAGWNTSLVFSTAARPQPQIGLKRNSPDPFESKWLSWIGPWSVEAFVSLQDEGGGRFDDDIIAGFRFDMQPVKGFTFGVKRALQLCGKGRPCGFSTWVDSLFPVGEADNTGTLSEPGNQMAGFDVRYGGRIGKVAFSLNGELIGEDETDFFPSKFSSTGGVKISAPWGVDGARWDLIAEYSDTLANRTWIKKNFPNTTYQNFIYSDGWRYRGRSLGGSLDNDTRLITVTGQFTDTRNRFYRLTFHNADINSDGRGRHTISLNDELIKVIEAETIIPTPFGDVRAEIRLQDDEPNTPLTSKVTGAFELSYQVRF